MSASLARIPLSDYSSLQLSRLSYSCAVPASLADASRVRVAAGDATASALRSEAAALRSWLPRTFGAPLVALEAGADAAAAAAARPLTVGVVFCGRQTPGAHSLVCGLADALAARAPGSTLLGFVGGVRGLLASPPQVAALDAAALAPFRHQGGMHLLGRSVDRVRSRAEQQAALAAATALGLDGLVLVGGTFTASDAAHLAEAFAEAQAGGALRTAVVAAPVTIDGDIKNEFVETTLGHDTATKVFAQLVGNMATDSNSAKKYWYFVKLMGRATGHITMEVALQTRPNVVILAEDIERRKLSLRDVISEIADAVAARAAAGKNFGVVLVPEGAVAAIPEVATLIAEMSKLLRGGAAADAIPGLLTPWSAAVLAFLPPVIRGQFFLERESSGSVQLTQIASETMLAELVGAELAARAKNGTYKGKYATVNTSFGYHARSAMPSNFDCAYGTALGSAAAALVGAGCNGYMAVVSNLAAPPAEWRVAGVPLPAMLRVPVRADAHAAAADCAPFGAQGARPCVPSAPVDVHGAAFAAFLREAAVWRTSEDYTNRGPIQFTGVGADDVSASLALTKGDHMARILRLRAALDDVRDACRPGVAEALLVAAEAGVAAILNTLHKMQD